MPDAKVSALSTAAPAAGDYLYLVDDPGSTAPTSKAAPLSAVGGVMHVRDQRNPTVEGDANSTGWQTRVLQTIVTNEIGGSVASNQITLAAGSYNVRAEAQAHRAERHRLRIRLAGGATLIVGRAAFCNNSDSSTSMASVVGKITIGSTKIELQHYTEIATASNGFGIAVAASTSDEPEVYADVWLEKTHSS